MTLESPLYQSPDQETQESKTELWKTAQHSIDFLLLSVSVHAAEAASVRTEQGQGWEEG